MQSKVQVLGDFVSLVSGNTPSKANSAYWNGATPWVSAKDMADFWIEDSEDHLTDAGVAVASRVVPAGSVLILTRGMTLHKRVPICRVATPSTFNQDVKAVLPKDSISPRFLPYLLVGNHDRLHERVDSAGHGTGRLNTDALLSLPVCVPTKLEQEHIADFAEAIDDRLRLLRQTNATLESIAQALFKSWFIDFDPVRAKAEGREPEGMDANTAALFPASFENSEFGEIPKGWAGLPFGELLSFAIGGDWGAENQTDMCTQPTSIIRGTDIPDIAQGKFNGVPRRFVSLKKYEKRSLQDGDLVIEVSGGSKTQPTGRSLYVTKIVLAKLGSAVVPTSFCRLFRATDTHTALLLSQHLTAIYQAGKMWNYQVQSTGLANFQTQHFLDSEIVVAPPASIRKAFFDIVRPLIDRMNAAPIAELTALRDALLPRLVSGKLRLPEAGAQLNEALA